MCLALMIPVSKNIPVKSLVVSDKLSGYFRSAGWQFSVMSDREPRFSRVIRPFPLIVASKALSGFRSPVPQRRKALFSIQGKQRVELKENGCQGNLQLVKFVSRESRLNILINFAQMLMFFFLGLLLFLFFSVVVCLLLL